MRRWFQPKIKVKEAKPNVETESKEEPIVPIIHQARPHEAGWEDKNPSKYDTRLYGSDGLVLGEWEPDEN